MLKMFWVVFVLVAVLLIPNARYAVRQYLADRNKLIFTIYMLLLVGLGYMLITITTHLLAFAQASQDILNAP